MHFRGPDDVSTPWTQQSDTTLQTRHYTQGVVLTTVRRDTNHTERLLLSCLYFRRGAFDLLVCARPLASAFAPTP